MFNIDSQVLVTRTSAAPRELVFEACTKSEQETA